MLACVVWVINLKFEINFYLGDCLEPNCSQKDVEITFI